MTRDNKDSYATVENLPYFALIDACHDAVSCWKVPKGVTKETPVAKQVELLHQSVCVALNDKVLKAYGYTRKDDVLGKAYLEIANEQVCEFLEAFIDNGYKITSYPLKQTSYNDVSYLGSEDMIGVFEGDELKYIWNTSRNLTEIEKKLVSLKRDVSKLKLMFENTKDALVLIKMSNDGKLQFNEANKAICDLLEYDHDEFLKLSVFDIFTPKHRDLVKKIYSGHAPENSNIYELEFMSKSGIPIPAEMQSTSFSENGDSYIVSVGLLE